MTSQSKPSVTYYLASRCPGCGAAKLRPSATAYVYCDFCGALADYDFKKACEQPKDLPGPVYEKLAATLKSQCEKAVVSNDRKKYLDTQLKLFEAWVEACPNAVPVRVKDAGFKRQYVAHMAECATACAFDDASKKISEDMTLATSKHRKGWFTMAGGIHHFVTSVGRIRRSRHPPYTNLQSP